MNNDTYYLDNFRGALHWIVDRYTDLLLPDERDFIANFSALPQESQALLVRLLMRKGPHFRASKLCYPEIGDLAVAVVPLIALGWIDTDAELTVPDLFAILTRAELAGIFPAALCGSTKSKALKSLLGLGPRAHSFDEWYCFSEDRVYSLTVTALCTRFRLLFFGNFDQQWSTFVLADLGILKFEPIEIARESRAFQDRRDMDAFFALFECRRRMEASEPLDSVLAPLPRTPLRSDWLEERRAKLLFQVAREFERGGQPESALPLYLESSYPESRRRAIRMMELARRFTDAHRLAQETHANPSNNGELRNVKRILKRLDRRLGNGSAHASTVPARREISVVLAKPPTSSVEYAIRDHLSEPEAPVFYVENALINSLFGLLFWGAVVAPVPGAFFNRFQAAPMDLFSRDFRRRRERLFEEGFQCLERGEHRALLQHTFHEKHGLQSPFVRWQAIGNRLLTMALACIPPDHLARYFEHLLADLRSHRCGLPDLIQFWPKEGRYRLIEVKGPGDRLQENQTAWFDYCAEHALPILVCHVRWSAPEGQRTTVRNRGQDRYFGARSPYQ